MYIYFYIYIYLKIVRFVRYCGRILYSRTGHRRQHGAWAIHVGHLKLEARTHNMSYLLLFHCKKCCKIAPHKYEVLEENPVPVPLFPPQIPHKLTYSQTLFFDSFIHKHCEVLFGVM